MVSLLPALEYCIKLMKVLLQILISIFLAISCQSQEINVNYEDIEINIPGKPGAWLKFKGKYFCYFETDNDKFNTGSNYLFYIIDKNGKTQAKIDVPQKLQTFYYDLYLKNDTIFTTEYYNHHTFYLDLKNNKWIETKKGEDLYYDDKDYTVYSIDLGEWGGVTWFKNKQSNIQYEIGATTPMVNKLNNSYYLTTRNAILKINNPEKLDVSEEPYDYKKVVLEKNYFRQGNYLTNGAETLFKYENDDEFNPTFSFVTSFISENQIYHIYKDSISTKIGELQNNILVPVYTFQSDLTPIRWRYNTRNRIQNNNHQTLQFYTDKDNVYGIIEIKGNKINVNYFENSFQETVFGEDNLKEWFEDIFDMYYSSFENLTLDQIDEIEHKLNATDLTQAHEMKHYLLEGKDIQTPRIFRKIESSEISLVTMYYYTTEQNKVELIEFEWRENRNKNLSIEDIVATMFEEPDTKELYKSKFEWISNYLKDKIGKPSSMITKNNRTEQIWEKEKVIIKLNGSISNVKLTMYKR